MKRDFLKGLDLGEGAKLPDSAIDAIMAEHGKTKQSLESQISTLQGQLTEANGKLANFDPEWEAKAAAAQEKLEAQKFDYALERAVAAAKPRSTKAVLAFIDRSKCKLVGDEVVGLDKQLEGLKTNEDTAFLFESENKPTRTGASHQGGHDVGGTDKKEEANNALRAAFGSRE